MGRGVALVGKPGRGKTTLACAVVNEAQERLPKLSVGFTTFEGYIKRERRIMALERRILKFEDVDEIDELRRLEGLQMDMRTATKLLLIDDIGKEHTTGTGYAEDEFDFLLRTRYDAALTTVLTSNIPLEAWGGRYSEAMQSFVHEAFVIVEVTGRDHRTQ